MKESMNSFAEQLSELDKRCNGDYALSEDDRALIHTAYWNGNMIDIFSALDLICYEPKAEDMPVLLDASSPGSIWTCRCTAAQALTGLGKQGATVLRVMKARETHPTVRFYVLRELIEMGDPCMDEFLNKPIPPVSSPNHRALWIFGKFENGALSKDKAEFFLTALLSEDPRRHNWLRDHIDDSKSES
jgi:hypothetical protein